MITVPRLDINDARILLEGARNKAHAMGFPMCIAISDDSGNLIAFERMDGSKAHSILISQDKAYTAGASRKATHELNAANTPGNLAYGLNTECGGRLSSVGGGYPIFIDEACVGGIGTSGGSADQDMEVSVAAIEYFHSKQD